MRIPGVNGIARDGMRKEEACLKLILRSGLGAEKASFMVDTFMIRGAKTWEDFDRSSGLLSGMLG